MEGATHESLLYDKGDAKVSSAAIAQVVKAARRSATDPVTPIAANFGAQIQ
jgi:hypothetical protein